MPTKKERKRCVKCGHRLTIDQMIIYSTGWYRSKIKYICNYCQSLRNKSVQQDPDGHRYRNGLLQEVDTVKLL
jgi:endonuclease III